MNPQGEHPKHAKNPPGANSHHWPWRFIVLVTILASGIALVSQARRTGGQDQVAWRYSYNQANIEAEENAKPLLIAFTADWCPPCTQMKAWVFSDAKIAESIEAGFVPVQIDLSSEGLPDQHLADKYGVINIPTFLTLTTDGRPISITTGYLTKDQLMAWLENATERYVQMSTQAQNPSPPTYVEVETDEGQNH